jgi:hypothetical protein
MASSGWVQASSDLPEYWETGVFVPERVAEQLRAELEQVVQSRDHWRVLAERFDAECEQLRDTLETIAADLGEPRARGRARAALSGGLMNETKGNDDDE